MFQRAKISSQGKFHCKVRVEEIKGKHDFAVTVGVMAVPGKVCEICLEDNKPKYSNEALAIPACPRVLSEFLNEVRPLFLCPFQNISNEVSCSLVSTIPDPAPGAVKRARPHPHLDLLEGVEVPGVLPLRGPLHGHRGQLGLRDGLADGGDVAASLGPDVAVPHATRGERGGELGGELGGEPGGELGGELRGELKEMEGAE